MREHLSLDSVVALAEAGEAFTLEAGDVPVQDLLFLAQVIGGSSATVRFRNTEARSLEDLMKITVASRGRVHLDTTQPARPPASPRRSWLKGRIARPRPVAA